MGLDVVKNKIEGLGGQIDIESTKGQGSIFTIQLPLTLSIITTILVEVQETTYAIPLSSIVETLILEPNQILYVNSQRVINLYKGQIIPLVSLLDVFHAQDMEANDSETAIVIVKKRDQLIGLMAR